MPPKWVPLNDPLFRFFRSLDGTDFTGSAPKYPVLSKVRPEDRNIKKPNCLIRIVKYGKMVQNGQNGQNDYLIPTEYQIQI